MHSKNLCIESVFRGTVSVGISPEILAPLSYPVSYGYVSLYFTNENIYLDDWLQLHFTRGEEPIKKNTDIL